MKLIKRLFKIFIFLALCVAAYLIYAHFFPSEKTPVPPKVKDAVSDAVTTVSDNVSSEMPPKSELQLSLAVAAAQSQCPIEISRGISLTSIKDEKENVAVTVSVDGRRYPTRLLRGNTATVKRMFIKELKKDGQGRKIISLLVENGKGIDMALTERPSGQTMKLHITPEDLKN